MKRKFNEAWETTEKTILEQEDSLQKPKVIQFCRDYQERTCLKTDCEYIHGTIAEEEQFLRQGVLPSYRRLVQQ